MNALVNLATTKIAMVIAFLAITLVKLVKEMTLFAKHVIKSQNILELKFLIMDKNVRV
jgi:hypothetical protein